MFVKQNCFAKFMLYIYPIPYLAPSANSTFLHVLPHFMMTVHDTWNKQTNKITLLQMEWL